MALYPMFSLVSWALAGLPQNSAAANDKQIHIALSLLIIRILSATGAFKVKSFGPCRIPALVNRPLIFLWFGNVVKPVRAVSCCFIGPP